MTEIDINEIPDLSPNPVERYMYVQHVSEEPFHEVFDRIGEDYSGDMPASGGVMNEEVVVKTPAGDDFCCLSIRGDFEAWIAVVIDFANANNLATARIEDDKLCIDRNGSTEAYLLESCRAFSTD